jgi:chemotaxis protein MotB
VAGHVAAQPVVVAEARGWDRSIDRAQSMRTLLTEQGLEPTRVVRVTGHADRRPVGADRISVRNDRVVIALLREF